MIFGQVFSVTKLSCFVNEELASKIPQNQPKTTMRQG